MRLQRGRTKKRIAGVLISFCYLIGSFNPGYADSAAEEIHSDRASSITASSDLTRVWAVDDSEKIRQFDLHHPLAESESNLVWDGERIHLFGARNEIVAFQLILQSGRSAVPGVDVYITDLRNGSATIPNSGTGSADPYNYVGRNIELFTEHYIEIVDPSRGGSAWSDAADPGPEFLGWVPDALIPFAAPPGQGGSPFEIPRSANQAVWADIWVPWDSPAGLYRGEVQISENGTHTRSIPIELHVHDFALPDETHFPNMFGFEPSDIASRHGVKIDTVEFYEIETRYHHMAHRHRFDLVQSVRNLSQIRRYHNRYLTGSIYAGKYGYAGPGEGIGNRTFSIGFYGNLPVEYGGDPGNWTKEKWWAGSDAWAKWFYDFAPQVSIHKFLLPDEPQTASDLRAIRTQAEWSHNNPGFGASIPTLSTHWIDPNFIGFTDIFSISANHALSGVSPGTSPGDAAAALEAGGRVGVYNGYRPATGSTFIDTPATDFRVIPWIGWKYELDHYFYWMTNYWTDWISGGEKWNLFTNPRTTGFQRNGAGTFFYPGQDAVYRESDRGLQGPIASIRMKNWRRGMQDYEYLWLARELGLGEELQVIVDETVPAALWDSSPADLASWSEHGSDFESARERLASLIAKRLQGPSRQAAVDSPTFIDVGNDHPYAAQINRLYQEGYLGGCSQDPAMFCPDRPITRAESSVLYGRAIFGQNGATGMPSDSFFEDMPLAGGVSWATPWASALGKGGFSVSCSEDPSLFCPENELTRLDAAILALQTRYGRDYHPPQPDGLFADISLNWWGSGWIEAAYRLGLLKPCVDQPRMRSCPYGTLTRGEAAGIVDAALR